MSRGSFAVNYHYDIPPDPDMSNIRRAGFRWVRVDIPWGSVEQSLGVYSFASTDTLMNSVTSHGLRAIAILGYNNSLYFESGQTLPGLSWGIVSQEQTDAFIAYALACVERYAGDGHVWEIWNEPNVDGFWRPAADAEAYSEFAKAVAQAIRAEFPDEYIAAPAVSTTIYYPAADYLETCGRSGLFEHLDVVTIHGYTDYLRYTAPMNPESFVPAALRATDIVAKYVPRKPLFCSEWGFSSADLTDVGNKSFDPSEPTFSNGATLMSPNMVAHTNDFSNVAWVGYWLKPDVVTGVDDPFGMPRACRAVSADDVAHDNKSGFYQAGSVPAGYYTVSVYLRCLSGKMDFVFGISDSYVQSAVADDKWRRYWITFNVTSTQSRVFQIYEVGEGNTAWEIACPMVEAYTGTEEDLVTALEERQGELVGRMFDAAKEARIKLLTVYNWADDGEDPTEVQDCFGLVTKARQDKPALAAVRAAMRRITS